jgi:mono/diheme cytochrome c family protein
MPIAAGLYLVALVAPAAALADVPAAGTVAGVSPAGDTGADPWPAGAGSEIARRACHDCHDPIVITASRLTAAQWSARVDAMLAKGAKVEDEEIDVLIAYLATHFGARP